MPGPTKAKAKKILRDGTAHGKPLTEKQKKFFGAVVSGEKPYKKRRVTLPVSAKSQ